MYNNKLWYECTHTHMHFIFDANDNFKWVTDIV